jgi:putative FmdB family regulatory protein
MRLTATGQLLIGRLAMPVYEYRCEGCDHPYNVLMRIEEREELRPCPKCGSEEVRKIISSVSVVRSDSQKAEDRQKTMPRVDPTNPQEVAKYFRDHGSRFGEDDFRGTDTWHDAVDRVAEGGPTLDE